MNPAEDSTAKTASAELELPDWSGMDDSAGRVSAPAAFELCERYATWFPEAAQRARAERPPKCDVEFVL